MSLSDAIASSYEDHDHPTTTRVDSEQASNALIAWGQENGYTTVRQLTPRKLRAVLVPTAARITLLSL